MSTRKTIPVSIVIPTYRRERVLLDTLDYLLGLNPAASEILVIDQTESHQASTEFRLKELTTSGCIRWLTIDRPSIPNAMNRGLMEATQEIVIFVDDDIRPEPELLTAHLSAHRQHPDVIVAGRVIQPWDEGLDLATMEKNHFARLKPAWIDEFMGGNFSIRRDTALALCGFDENFVRVAYRFEAEFAYRFRSSNRRIYFEPRACLHHLKAVEGGTRTFGEHLTTFKPDHAVGAYYYCLRTWTGWRSLKTFLCRPLKAMATRHHLRHPWWIPGTAVAEFWGMCWAVALSLRGPRYVKRPDKESPIA